MPYTVEGPDSNGKFKLKKKDGSGYHKQGGKVTLYDSMESARGAAHYIGMSEHMDNAFNEHFPEKHKKKK